MDPSKFLCNSIRPTHFDIESGDNHVRIDIAAH
jgi:hypothetical protein